MYESFGKKKSWQSVYIITWASHNYEIKGWNYDKETVTRYNYEIKVVIKIQMTTSFK